MSHNALNSLVDASELLYPSHLFQAALWVSITLDEHHLGDGQPLRGTLVVFK